MSTLKVNAFQDTSGKGFYPARTWINFNGSGAIAIRDSENVSSITDNTTGDYRVNFSNNMGNTSYAPTFGSQLDHNDNKANAYHAGIEVGQNSTDFKTGSLDVWYRYAGYTALLDGIAVIVLITGDM